MAKKKTLSLLLALALLFACLPDAALASSGYALTGQGADDIVAVAQAKLGSTGRELGYSFEWCACFVTWAGRMAGQDFPDRDLYTPLDVARYFTEGGRGSFYCFRQETYLSLLQGGAAGSAVLTSHARVVPEKGDLVCFLWAKDIEKGYNWSHIGILTRDYDGSGVLHTIEGNTGAGDGPQSRRVCLQDRAYDASVVGIIRPAYTTRGREVRHYLEDYGGTYTLVETETVTPAGKEFTLDDALRAIHTYDTHGYPELDRFVSSVQAAGPLEIYYPRLYTLALIPGNGVQGVTGTGQYTAGTEVTVEVRAPAGSELIWTDDLVRQRSGSQWTLIMPEGDVLLGVSARKRDCVEPFLDVEKASWYAPYVAEVQERGLMQGTAADAFSPERGVTLAEAVTLAVRLHTAAAGIEADFTPQNGEPWYAPYAAYAREHDLLPEGELDFRSAATRADFARILGRVLAPEDLAPLWEAPVFADLEGEAVFPEAELLYRAGVLSGEAVDGAQYFRPARPITRAEAAAATARMADASLRLKPKAT